MRPTVSDGESFCLRFMYTNPDTNTPMTSTVKSSPTNMMYFHISLFDGLSSSSPTEVKVQLTSKTKCNIWNLDSSVALSYPDSRFWLSHEKTDVKIVYLKDQWSRVLPFLHEISQQLAPMEKKYHHKCVERIFRLSCMAIKQNLFLLL